MKCISVMSQDTNNLAGECSVVVTFRGHPQVNATDTRALEILDTDEWVAHSAALGFAATYDPNALLRLRGRVHVEVEVGGITDVFEATIAANYNRGAPLVFRRDTKTQGNPLGSQSSKAAADLDRKLVDSLRAPHVSGRLTITPIPLAELPVGYLAIVGMPIGHQADLSPRALGVLSSVDVILAEDTRIAEKALRWRGVITPIISCHEHNEQIRVTEVARRLARGQRLALVTDAGTPLVSDPGFRIVQAAVSCGAHVTAIPGPSALLVALVVSGLPVASFRFGGFVPRKSGQRAKFVHCLLGSHETTIVFESGQRVATLLATLSTQAPDRNVALCKDLTKRTEEVLRGTTSQIAVEFAARADQRGEYTLVVAPCIEEAVAASQGAESALCQPLESESFIVALLAEGCPTLPIAKALRRTTGMSQDKAYARVQALVHQIARRAS